MITWFRTAPRAALPEPWHLEAAPDRVRALRTTACSLTFRTSELFEERETRDTPAAERCPACQGAFLRQSEVLSSRIRSGYPFIGRLIGGRGDSRTFEFTGEAPLDVFLLPTDELVLGFPSRDVGTAPLAKRPDHAVRYFLRGDVTDPVYVCEELDVP
jgi:hypothetical protein